MWIVSLFVVVSYILVDAFRRFSLDGWAWPTYTYYKYKVDGMTIGEVMKAIPGLTMPFLYYLEAKGYIAPQRVQKERLARREYSEEDVALLRSAFALYKKGYSPRMAFAEARGEQPQGEPGIVASLQFSGLSQDQVLVHQHTGDGEDRVFTPIVPQTQICAIVEAAPGNPDRFVLRVSLLIGDSAKPYVVSFRKGVSVIRSVTLDDRGSGIVQNLSREDVDALRQHTRLDVALLNPIAPAPALLAHDNAGCADMDPPDEDRAGSTAAMENHDKPARTAWD
jgi:hypothetical protein